MKIAMVGTKGIPAKWGGIEKYIEEISLRLVGRGHRVTVYGSRWFCRDLTSHNYKNVRVVQVPSVHVTATDALTNAFWATLFILFERFDVVHFHGYAAYYFVPIVNFFHIPTVITAHGVESGWDNPKYGTFARRILRKAFRTGISNATAVTTVAGHLTQKVKEEFHADAVTIAAGMDRVDLVLPDIIRREYDLQGQDYLLFIGRIDPIKRIHWIVELADILPAELKVVIAGGAQDRLTGVYLDQLKEKAGFSNRIFFTGPVSGQLKGELFSNCLALLAPSEYEGLPITLLEAFSYGKSCIASDISAHREVIRDGENGFLFSSNQKEQFLQLALDLVTKSPGILEQAGQAARRQGGELFNWEKTTEDFERIYRDISHGEKKQKR